MPFAFCGLPDLCYVIMIIKAKLSEYLFRARLTLLTALSHLIHTQLCEAATNVSLLWISKEGLSLREVTPGPRQAGKLDVRCALTPSLPRFHLSLTKKMGPGLLGKCHCCGSQLLTHQLCVLNKVHYLLNLSVHICGRARVRLTCVSCEMM